MPQGLMPEIGWATIIMAGLMHVVNPASLLGCLLFFILLVRAQKAAKVGVLFGVVLLFILIFG